MFDGRVSAIIDWGYAMYGDFLYDVAWLTFWSPWFVGMSGLDIRELVRGFFAAAGAEMRDFDERLRCYELHIGLSSIAYNAFTSDQVNLGRVLRRTLDFAR